MVLVDFLHNLVHDSTIIYGIHDSGAYQGEVSIKVYSSPDTNHIPTIYHPDIVPYNDYYPFGSQCMDAFNIYQPPISAECASLYSDTGDLWKCVCGEVMMMTMIMTTLMMRRRRMIMMNYNKNVSSLTNPALSSTCCPTS